MLGMQEKKNAQVGWVVRGQVLVPVLELVHTFHCPRPRVWAEGQGLGVNNRV